MQTWQEYNVNRVLNGICRAKVYFCLIKDNCMCLSYAVYILKCRNGQYYTGYSKNLNNRLKNHANGEVRFTKDKLPFEVVHISLFSIKQKAYTLKDI